MADWRDVTEARSASAEAIGLARTKSIEPDTFTDVEALVAGMIAVALELRALGTTIDYALTKHTNATGQI